MTTGTQVGQSDLRLLRVFSTVIECGGFTPAQLAMNVSQSTISSHMATLEARLNMRLCERGRGGFRITQNGQRVYEAAQRLFRSIDSFGSEVDALRGRMSGELHIGAVDNAVTNPDFALPDAIARFEHRHGDVQISLHMSTPAEIERAVVEGRYDIGIGAYTKKISAIEYTPLIAESQRLYCGSRHPLFDADTTRLADLARHKFVKRPYVPDEHIPRADRLQAAAVAENMEAIAILILSGEFIGFLPEHYAARWVTNGEMKTVLADSMRYQTQLELIVRKTVPKTLAAQYLRADLLEAFGAR
ncbi:MAG: LysR family transcriptional regulator [Hyphomicrobiales bacterium]